MNLVILPVFSLASKQSHFLDFVPSEGGNSGLRCMLPNLL